MADQEKEKQGIVNDKENVETTISEDLAEGQDAKLDASLKLLGDDDLKLLLPSDEPEDDGIHILETTTNAPQRGGLALQDYQMQLMLLEQQNKKRLLLRRQEEELTHPQFDPAVASTEDRRRYVANAIKKEQVQAAVASRDFKATQVTPRMPATGADKGTVPARKRQKRGDRSRTQLNEVNNSDIINGGDANTAQAESIEVSDHYIQV